MQVVPSPLTVAVMSLERFVAVCYPVRHPTIFTVRNTGMAIALLWAFMLLYFFTKSSQMNNFCSKEAIFFTPVFDDFEEVHASAVFLSVGAAVVALYIGVLLVARSVSTNKASARKALHSLLHLIQLSLSLTSTLFSNFESSKKINK